MVISLTCLDCKFNKPSSFSFSALQNLTSKLNCNAWSLLTHLSLHHSTLVQSCTRPMTKIPHKCSWGFFLQLMKSSRWKHRFNGSKPYVHHEPQWKQFTLMILVPVLTSNIRQGDKWAKLPKSPVEIQWDGNINFL